MLMLIKGARIAYVVCLTLLMTLSASLCAVEVKGIQIQDHVAQAGAKQSLVLNGTGIRTKFIFDIYVGALYLPKKSANAKQIINSSDAKRISMHFIYDKVEKKKMTDAWTEGFEDATDDAAFKAMQPRINQFNGFFPDMVKGDTIIIDFIPNKGTQVTINKALKGTVAGDDFQKALLSMWLGDSPPNEELKDGMLGIVEEE